MGPASYVQIQEEAFCVSLFAKAFGKGMNPSILLLLAMVE